MSETVTLSQARQIIKALAADESVLLLSSPGLGKSDIVRSAAAMSATGSSLVRPGA